MPLMKMNRDFILRGTMIPTIFFKAKVETWVATHAVSAAVKYGAEFVDEETETSHKEEMESNVAKQPKPAPVGDELEAKVMSVFEELVAVNDRETFTASGTPKMDVLKSKLGFDIAKKDADFYWKKMSQKLAGKDIPESNDDAQD